MILEPTSKKHSGALRSLELRSARMHHQLHSHKAAKKFYTKSYLVAHEFREKSAKLLAGVGITGALMLSPLNLPPDTLPSHQEIASTDVALSGLLSGSLQSVTPHIPTKLEPDQAKIIEDIIERNTGIKTKAVLEGQSLNHQVGFIGYEQHLQRFPGDSLDQHDDEQIAGIAPGLGGWRYFAPEKSRFTTTDYLREKYYSVAQLHLLPNWNSDYPKLSPWYKYRKILIVNPQNGKAVVTAMGDAGPAEWTGKQFGASPEAMKVLDLHKGPRKGLVLFLFVDDPDNLVPLGPLSTPYTLDTRT